MELWLVDINADLVAVWEKEFKKFSEVNVLHGNILELAENTIVSPGNSYGFMDGGIDRLYIEYFGIHLQTEVMKAVSYRPEGYLPVGTGAFILTGDPQIPYMIAAPTMMTPGPVKSANCFFAMIAVLKVAYQNRKAVQKVFCPGLATGIGKVHPHLAAKEMANAYRKWVQKYGVLPK